MGSTNGHVVLTSSGLEHREVQAVCRPEVELDRRIGVNPLGEDVEQQNGYEPRINAADSQTLNNVSYYIGWLLYSFEGYKIIRLIG